MSNLKTIEHNETPSSAMTPMDMLSRAISSGASVEMMERLLSMQERWESAQARKAFDAALSAAKAEIPVIAKTSKGHNNKSYADFAAIARVIDPIISKHGLSYRFRTRQDDKIAVTCILAHEDGHFEETTLAGPADSSGSKNAIQAIGSTLTYLQRYSLVQALGLAASEDDDGRAMDSAQIITAEQAKTIRELIEQTKTDISAFCTYMRIQAVPDLPASKFEQAVGQLKAKARGARS